MSTWEQAIQWDGHNMADVLAFTGHRNVVINTFGDPVIYHEDARHSVIEKGDWAFRDHTGVLNGCPMTLRPSVEAQLLRISELELAHTTVTIALGHTSALAETLQKQRDKVLVMCREAAELSDGNCGIAVRTIEIFAGKETSR